MEKGNRNASALIRTVSISVAKYLDGVLSAYQIFRTFTRSNDQMTLQNEEQDEILDKKILRRKYEMVKYENENGRNKAKKRKCMMKIMQINNLYI